MLIPAYYGRHSNWRPRDKSGKLVFRDSQDQCECCPLSDFQTLNQIKVIIHSCTLQKIVVASRLLQIKHKGFKQVCQSRVQHTL